MQNKAVLFNWVLLLVCALVAITGIFQFSYLVGLSLYSTHFNINSIELVQIGLISSGIWGISEFSRTIKKIKAVPKYN